METLRFDELNLSPQILRAVKEMGFEEASPIQGKAIPVAMTGADIIRPGADRYRKNGCIWDSGA